VIGKQVIPGDADETASSDILIDLIDELY